MSRAISSALWVEPGVPVAVRLSGRGVDSRQSTWKARLLRRSVVRTNLGSVKGLANASGQQAPIPSGTVGMPPTVKENQQFIRPPGCQLDAQPSTATTEISAWLTLLFAAWKSSGQRQERHQLNGIHIALATTGTLITAAVRTLRQASARDRRSACSSDETHRIRPRCPDIPRFPGQERLSQSKE
jgi:hypothetical protein